MPTLVPAVCWVPKGVSKEVPDKVELSPQEVKKLLQEANDQLKGLDLEDYNTASTKEKVEEFTRGNGMVTPGEGEERLEENIEKFYDLEHYDSDEEGNGQSISGAGMGNNLAGLSYYSSNDNDPYITLKNMSDDEDEKEDYRVLPTDNLLVIGRAEEDFSSVEIHVYNEVDDHSHSHHEILLTAFPLALEWLDYDPEQPNQKGNYVAIGTMAPVIEVWDLDTVDVLEPVFCLGDPDIISCAAVKKGRSKSEKVKKKKKKKKSSTQLEATSAIIDGHTDSVLGLSWSKVIRNILASASADHTVRVWDMAWPKSVLTLKHPDKVQCCLWHPYQPELLATGAYDGIVRLYNCKSSESPVRSWNLESEVERVLWNHFKPEQLLASSENSTVWCFDKNDGSALFQIHAHSSSITDLSLSCYMPGLLVTASADDTIKFWDINDNKPVYLLSREMHMGAVMCAKFSVDSAYSLVVGGRKNGFHLINVQTFPAVMQSFKKRDLMMPVLEHVATNDISSDAKAEAMLLNGDSLMENDVQRDSEIEVGRSDELAEVMSDEESEGISVRTKKLKPNKKRKKHRK